MKFAERFVQTAREDFETRKKAPRIAKAAATPITRWKWPAMNASLTEAGRDLAGEHNARDAARQSETNPSAKSMAVLSWIWRSRVCRTN